MNCSLCNEPMGNEPSTNGNPAFPMHRACGLRSALGGIGHLIAHEHWCLQRGDPDAGLTYRQSALLVDAYVRVMGVEAAAGITTTTERTSDG
jgi:hypothetical protein